MDVWYVKLSGNLGNEFDPGVSFDIGVTVRQVNLFGSPHTRTPILGPDFSVYEE